MSSPHFYNNAGYGSSGEMGFFPLDPIPLIDQVDGGYSGDEIDKRSSLKDGEEVEGNGSSALGKNGNITKLCARGHWRAAEDAKLVELVSQFGPRNWNSIAEHLHGRSGKSCRLRWYNQLDPRINRSAFTAEEEAKLLAAHRVHGNKWAIISKFFPGRTDNAVKNHWHVIMARRKREQNRLRNPTFQSPESKVLNLVLSNNNAASESTISSTIDESASACTNLSLIPSSFKSIPRAFHNQNPFYAYGSQMGLSGESMVPIGDVGFDNFFSAWNGSCDHGHMGKLMKGVDQSNCSFSNSEVSVSESVATNNTSASIFGENDDLENKISMPFIDFLGVGAT